MPIPILDDIISYGRLGWGIVSGLNRWRKTRKRILTPQEKLELRGRWKPQFETWILEHNRKQLRHDCIIRDMKRMDHYPNVRRERERNFVMVPCRVNRYLRARNNG